MKVMFIINDLGVNEPFGPMLLSAVLKGKGCATTLGVLQKEDVEKKIQSWKPDILAYSMMSVDMNDMREFNTALRKKIKIFSLLGGPHATLDRNSINESGIDAICIGEGEDAIIDVVESLKKGKSLEGISNIMLPGGEFPKLRNLIDNFDDYPFMDRDLVYRYSESRRFGIKGIWTSRGCIFPCPYCFNNRYNEIFKNSGGIVRRRSVDSIIRETRELSEVYPVKFIRIQDDVFTHKADDWLKEFAQRWSEEIHLSFYCLLRAELVTDKMAFYLKKAGCFSICMSIESANDDVRMRMMRRNVTKNQLENAFCIFKKYKINVYTNTMVGLPFTTLKQDIESLDFAVKVQPEFPDFSIFMPYPGTDLGDYCKRAGIYDPVEDEITYGMRNMSPLACFTKKEKEVQYNICELAIVAVRFPFLRNLIVKHFIYWKPNKIFFLIQYFSAIAAYGRKIFYYKHTFTEYGELLLKTFKFYLYDFTKKKEKCDIKRIQKGSLEAFFVLTQEERFSEFKKCLEAMSTHKNILLKS